MKLTPEQRNNIIMPLRASADWFLMSGCSRPELSEKWEGFALDRLMDAAEIAGFQLVPSNERAVPETEPVGQLLY